LSAVLRASGENFDVDAFVAGCAWELDAIWRRGEPVFKTRPDGHTRVRSGLNYAVSVATFHEFAEQIEDAIAFLKEDGEEVRRLVAFDGVEGVVIDFGVAWCDVVAQSEEFPAQLVRLAGVCGISLGLSHYPVSGS